MRILIVLFVIALTSSLATAQWGSIKGEGDVVKEEIQLETITGVALGFSGDIYLTQGSPQKIVIEAQKNIIDNIERDVRSGTWQVTFKENVKDCKPVKIYITMATLEKAGVSGSGNLMSKGAFGNLDDLDTYVSGSGEVVLEISAKDVESAISGSGSIKLSGDASKLEVAISGSGDVEALDLRVRECEVAISGSGDAEVNVTEGLEVAIAGSGDVRYRGEPAKVKSSVSGSGDVESVE